MPIYVEAWIVNSYKGSWHHHILELERFMLLLQSLQSILQ